MMRAAFGLLRTQAFRIVLVYVLLFALSVTSLLAFTYWNTRRTLDAQTDQIIEAEITGLSEQYQRLGVRGLGESVISRSLHGGQALYLLSDAAHRPIAGNLDSWPNMTAHAGEFVEFDYERRVNGIPETRRARGSLTPLSLEPLAHDVAELYEPLAEERKITLNLALGEAPMIEGNASLIAQALANLVDNAIKYTPPGGTVTVGLSSGASGVELCVADSGPGIAPHERARVVERFVRLEASRNSPGTGLGLSLVAAVAHFHNAELVLEDNDPGLRASLRFPRPALRLVPPAPRLAVRTAAE